MAGLKEMGIRAEASSPYHPQSNGLAEASIKNVKSLLYKTKYSRENFEKALAQWLQTPRRDGFSPSDLFFKRHLRGLLPSVPRTIDMQQAIEARDKQQEKYRKEMSKHKALQPMKQGDKIVTQNLRTGLWDIRGTVESVRENGRSYWIRTEEDDTYLRGRKLIRHRHTDRQTDEETDRQTDSDSDPLPGPAVTAPDRETPVSTQTGSEHCQDTDGPPAGRTRSRTVRFRNQ